MRSTLICLFLHVLLAIQLSKFTQVRCSSHGVTCRTTQVAMTFMQWEGSCRICDLIENQTAQGRLRPGHRPSHGLEQEQYVECDTVDSSCNTSPMSHAKKKATRTESSHTHTMFTFSAHVQRTAAQWVLQFGVTGYTDVFLNSTPVLMEDFDTVISVLFYRGRPVFLLNCTVAF